MRQKAFSMGLSLDSRGCEWQQRARVAILALKPRRARSIFFCNLLLYLFRVNCLEFYATLHQKQESAGAVCSRL